MVPIKMGEKMKNIRIGNKLIGPEHKPFIVAEMSGNHNQSLKHALDIVEKAKWAGADAIKLQTYTADTMTIDVDLEDYIINDKESLWYGESLYKLYDKARTPYEWHEPIFNRCKQLGLLCFSTPFDNHSIDFLESLGSPCYKIASFENRDLNLIAKAASTGKPLIISTGMASLATLEDIVQTARKAGCNDLILLKCTSAYPSDPSEANTRTIPHLRDLFNVQVGLSDHTLGIGVAIGSVALGATFIEKHFTIKRSDGGVDSQFSMEPDEMKSLVKESEIAWKSLGKISYHSGAKEERSKFFRRSLIVCEDIKSGESLSHENIKALRPGIGLEPKFLHQLIGKVAAKDIKKGSPVSWDLISRNISEESREN